MALSGNRAEEVVARLARRSFLSLWSYANPRGKKGKELCDVLAVCDPHVVIFSVKHLVMPNSENAEVDLERWHRGAIEESVKQIYGAERWLRSATNVIRADGSAGLALPAPSRRQVHRIAVALGSSGSAPIYMGDFGRGFVHVLTEDSLGTILTELDTVEDLMSYLAAKEVLLRDDTRLLHASENDLLATYLVAGRRLVGDADLIVLEDGLWEHFVKRPEYTMKKEADRDSYIWDKIVDRFASDILQGRLEFGAELNQTERGLRVMAQENRFSRRVLGRSFKEFLELARTNKVQARFLKSPSNVGYVFLARPQEYPRRARTAELANRCLVARGRHPDISTVVGLASEQYTPGNGFSFDLVYLHIPRWTAVHQDNMVRMQAELGYFVNPRELHLLEDEYPNAAAGQPLANNRLERPGSTPAAQPGR